MVTKYHTYIMPDEWATTKCDIAHMFLQKHWKLINILFFKNFRLQQLGYQKPHLLGSEYTHLDFFGRKPLREDIGKRMLYRDAHMTGWSYKDITSGKY